LVWISVKLNIIVWTRRYDGASRKCYQNIWCNDAQIHKEHFFSAHDTAANEADEEEGGSLKEQMVTIQYEGEDYQVLVKPHETILEAALREDIDLPYSCQAGMCTACMGKCLSGKVQMDEEDGLTDNEIKQGYILTCVAHPATSGVVIEIE
jgi:ring-1,2-phenylacetyl-CoA epoxidase subunit PaaE